MSVCCQIQDTTFKLGANKVQKVLIERNKISLGTLVIAQMFNYTALQPSLRLESQMVRGNSTFIAYLILNSFTMTFGIFFIRLKC